MEFKMTIVIGVVVIIVGLICWIGQSLAFMAPRLAVKLGLIEPENEMDRTLYIIETKAHGLTDMLLTWIFPVSGLLMILDYSLWPILALLGGGIYIYFSGVIILHRVFLKSHGIKIGGPSSERGAYVFGVLWIFSAITMILLALQELGF
jgi:hypothetical protein